MIISDKKIIIIVIMVLAVTFGAGVYFYKDKILSVNEVFGPGAEQSDAENQSQQEEKEPEIPRADFGDKLPDGFPIDVPIEEAAAFEQSYILEYPGQKQSTVVFESHKSITENQKIYTDYLVKNNWAISDNYIDEKIVSFYARKDDTDVNIVIALDDLSKNIKISISLLNL